MMAKDSDKKAGHLTERVEEILERASFEKKLRSGKKLTVKLGADPSAPDLHLGHAVVLKKLKEFQDLGHRVVFIIGDFTATIGDPTGKQTIRRALSAEEVKKNSATYLKQVGKILDVKKIEVRFNSEWFSKMRLKDFIGITGRFSLARIMDREDFKNRMRQGEEVWLNEALYQALQAYDSVVIASDLELGGRDQKINMLAGRELQKKLGQHPQDIMTMPLLIGTDGVQKMSKSLGNYIAFLDSPAEMFGKIMSIPDSLIFHYAELAAFLEEKELEGIKFAARGRRAYDAKQFLAERIVRLYWGKNASHEAKTVFSARFARRGQAEEGYEEKVISGRSSYSLTAFVIALGGARSKSEARRLILGHAVEIGGRVITDPVFVIKPKGGECVRIGKKKFFKVVIK